MHAVRVRFVIPRRSRSVRGILVVGLVTAAGLIAGGGSGFAEPPASCATTLQSARAIRTGPAEEVELQVIHPNTCRAALTVTAVDGTFERIPIAAQTRRAFRLDAGNLCKLASIERAVLPPNLSTRALMRRGACEQEVLALSVERVPSPAPGVRAVREAQACAIVPVFERLSSPSARAHREVIPVEMTVASVINPPGTPGGTFQETDDVRVKLAKPTDPSIAAPIANRPVDPVQLSKCDAR